MGGSRCIKSRDDLSVGDEFRSFLNAPRLTGREFLLQPDNIHESDDEITRLTWADPLSLWNLNLSDEVVPVRR